MIAGEIADPRGAAARLAGVRAAIATRARDCGRDPDAVTLVAVSKTLSADEVWPTIAVGGQAIFGENRVQEAKGKWPDLRARAAAIGRTLELHLIGPLQSNKAGEAVELFDAIETVDRDKIAQALASRGHHTARNVACLHLAQTAIAEEEEGLVVLDGAADGSAILVAVVGALFQRPGKGVLGGDPTKGVEIGVTVELEHSAMELVGSRLGDHRDHGAGEFAVLRRECAGLDAELFDCVGVGRRVAVVTHTGDVVAAIQVKRNGSVAGVEPAVHLDILRRQSNGHGGGAAGVPGGAVVIGHHARRERELGVDIAIDQRQADDLVRLNGPAQYRVARVDLRGSLGDRDGLRLRADGEFDFNRQRLVHVEGEILLHEAFKGGSRRLDDVLAHGKVVDAVLPIAVCRRRARESGIHVGRLHNGCVYHRALLILHGTNNGSGSLLRPSGQQCQPKQQCDTCQMKRQFRSLTRNCHNRLPPKN